MKGIRTSIRARASKTSSSASNPVRHARAKAQNLISTPRKDKRIIKHSVLLSRIEKSKPQVEKRRRPSKKLVANLESLSDALPDAPAAGEAENSETTTAKIKHRSLKSRPGALKNKEKIISMEKDRFNKNMAQMATLQPSGVGISNGSQAKDTDSEVPTGRKWAALRVFIQQTMEPRPPSG